jgi:hypothetical protein
VSDPSTLAWLARFQAQFGAVVRAPLDARSGTLRADMNRYDPEFSRDALPGAHLPAEGRLAIYNQQYWFRLFGVMQSELPLTAHLVGFWIFNQIAQHYLLAHPPRHHDLGRAADGFVDFLALEWKAHAVALGPHGALPGEALLQAARIDAAYREVWRAPEQPIWHPSAADLARFAQLCLSPSAAFALVEEQWPLIALRQRLSDRDGERPAPLPPALSIPQRWAIFRTPQGIAQLPLTSAHARLLELLAQNTLGQALVRLEAEFAGEESEALAVNAEQWLAQSVALGFWCGARG